MPTLSRRTVLAGTTLPVPTAHAAEPQPQAHTYRRRNATNGRGIQYGDPVR
ncbi:hypothetical protein [Streptomyces sp. NPDC001833]|uniref:hypothetical protein n=1 Tax=Streptomyces sp. NPDC001833 TaxID=3154658 RepID=UPI003334705D